MRHLDEGTLQEWLERERSGMDAAHAAEVQRHLRACTACSTRATELEALGRTAEALLAAAPVDVASAADYAGVVARAERRRHPRRARRSVAVGWAATVTLALGAGWLTNELVRSDSIPAPAVRPAAPATTPADLRSTDPAPVPLPPGEDQRGREPEAFPATGGAAEGTAPPSPDRVVREASPEAGVARRAEVIVLPAPTAPRLPSTVVSADVNLPTQVPPLAAPDVGAAEVVVAATEAAVEPRYLSGLVTDGEGRPLEGVQVHLEGTGIGALTRADGSYLLVLGDRGLEPADVLHAQRIGFAPGVRRPARSGTDTIAADFQLTEQALALESVVVTGTAAANERRALGNTISTASDAVGIEAAGWQRSNRSEAEARAGFGLLLIPEAPVMTVHVRRSAERWLVRVVQRLDSGTEVTLTQSRGAPLADEAAGTVGLTVATLVRGELSVTASAPLPLDSLQAVLGQIR